MPGSFGENFPYSNFHDLNMDWIIKIAKDFLDQYTHIQEIIANGEQSLQDLTASGLEQLQTKADTLETLLQQWYDTHSADIANQLTEALADLSDWYDEHVGFLNQYVQDSIASFNTQATNKAQEVIASIPSDYTNLAKHALQTLPTIRTDNNITGTIYADFDTLPCDRITFYSGANPAHKPTAAAFVGYVITINYQGDIVNDNNRQFSIQLAMTCGSITGTENNTLYCRVKYSTWSEWTAIRNSNTDLINIISTIFTDSNTSGTAYADFDNFPVGELVFLSGTTTLHRPLPKTFTGYALTLNYYGKNATTETQFKIQFAFYIASPASGLSNRLYMRTKYADWTAWKEFNLNTNYRLYRGLKDFTVLGDSISVGISYPTTDHGVHVKSWAKYIAEDCNSNADVYAQGGLTTGGMISSPNYSTAITNSHGNQYAIIALGINDVNESVSLTTFETNYRQLVNDCLTNHQFVFCLTIPAGLQSAARADYNTVIRNVCNDIYGAFVLDTDDHSYEISPLTWNGHMSSTGYAGLASIIETCMDELMSRSIFFLHGLTD